MCVHSHSSGVGSDLLPFFFALARFSASPPSTTRGSREDCSCRACLALAELPVRNEIKHHELVSHTCHIIYL